MAGEAQLDKNFIESYSKNLARMLAEEFFESHEIIDGNDIVDFCKVNQVNFFILRVLFEEWKNELENLKRPYFNYQSDEVKNMMNDLSIVLSHNIQMIEEHFVPLLEDAIKNTIYLIFQPRKFLNDFYKNLSDMDQLTVRNIKSHAKYIKVHKALIVSLIKKFDGWYGDTSINIERVYELNYNLYEENKHRLKEPKELITKLTDLKPAHYDDFFLASSTITLDDIVNQPNIKVPEEEVKEEKEKNNVDIRSSITINQRFNFVNELFDGKFDEFDTAIDLLEKCTDFDSASELLVDKYVEEYGWDTEKQEVQEFFEIIAHIF